MIVIWRMDYSPPGRLKDSFVIWKNASFIKDPYSGASKAIEELKDPNKIA